MKKLMFLALLCAAALQLHAQEALILHRVHVAEAEIEDPAAVPSFFSDAGQMLFALINVKQPVIAASENEAHSTIRTRIEPAEGGTSIRFALSRGEEEYGEEGVAESIGVIPEAERNRSYNEFLNRSADEFARYLGRVAPEVRIQELAVDEETREVLDELLFTESMIKPFEASLWLGLATKRAGGDDDRGDPYYLHFPRHYFGEFTWFPVPNHGVSGTLFLEYSDFLSHANLAGAFETDGRSDNLYILPGLGYTYRTLGRFSAGFFAGLNAGALRIEAREDLVYEDGLNLLEGESEWVFFHFVVLKPFVSYALNESWSIKTSFALYITLLEMLPGPFQTDYYNQGDPGAEIQFLNLGVSYRW